MDLPPALLCCIATAMEFVARLMHGAPGMTYGIIEPSLLPGTAGEQLR